jgi:hypothetical protein
MLLKELKLQYNFVYKRTPGFKFQVSSFKFQDGDLKMVILSIF